MFLNHLYEFLSLFSWQQTLNLLLRRQAEAVKEDKKTENAEAPTANSEWSYMLSN